MNNLVKEKNSRPNLRIWHQKDSLWASDYHGAEPMCFALLQEFELGGSFELMLVEQRITFNYVV